MSDNGIKISSANGHYALKYFIETEFSHGSDALDWNVKDMNTNLIQMQFQRLILPNGRYLFEDQTNYH